MTYCTVLYCMVGAVLYCTQCTVRLADQETHMQDSVCLSRMSISHISNPALTPIALPLCPIQVSISRIEAAFQQFGVGEEEETNTSASRRKSKSASAQVQHGGE